jgi:hypothetical protein
LIVYTEFHQKVGFRPVLKTFEHYQTHQMIGYLSLTPLFITFFWHYDKYKVSKNLGIPLLKAIAIMEEEPSHLHTRLSIPQSYTTRCGTWAPHNTQVPITLFMDVVVQCRICHSLVFDLCNWFHLMEKALVVIVILCCRILLSLANLNIN